MSEIPGFYKDSAGRYFSIPTNPCTYVPDFHTKMNKEECKVSSFNKLSLNMNKSTVVLKEMNTSGIRDTFMRYQTGTITKKNFELQVTKLKLRCMDVVNPRSLYPGVVCWMDDIDVPCTCKQVLSNGSICIGVWSRWGIASVNKITKIYKRKKCKNSDVFELSDIGVNCITSTRKRIVNHLSLAQFSGRNFTMLCAADTHYTFSSHLTLSSFDNVPLTNSYPINKVTYNDLYRTCTSSSKTNLIALGKNRGFDVLSFTHDGLMKSILPNGILLKRSSCEDQKAVEFISSGNVVFVAASYGKLIAYDIRTNNIANLSQLSRGIEYMKLLNNDWTLIASAYDNKLLNVDLRMNKVVFEYPYHVNKHRKLPFTYDEYADILCVTGQDNVTRFWSLKLGEPLASLEPPVETEDQVHSIFTYEKHALSTSVFFDKRMNCYEPVGT